MANRTGPRPGRPSAWPVVLLCALVLVVFGFMVWRYWPGLARALGLQEAPIDWLQSSLLCAGAAICVLLGVFEPSRSRGWNVVALALLAAALDQRFGIHQRLRDAIDFGLLGRDPAAPGRTGHLPMLAYSAAGLLLLAWLRRGPAPFTAMRWIVAAVVVGAASIGLDIASTDLAVQAVEESLELLAETLFVCGVLRHAQQLAARAGP
jgi:hypothetical protein